MNFPSFRLDGQVALVTGGNRGLGALGARAFAAAGADVIVAARGLEQGEQVAAEIRATGRRALALEVDVRRRESVDAMAARALDAFGRVDILFNNAGVIATATVTDLEEDAWDDVMDVSAKGTWLCVRALVPQMAARGSGRIINMASILASHGIPNRSPYCAAKAAVANLTRAMAVELGPKGINVNAVAPTVFVTDLNRHLIEKQPQVYGTVLARMPLGRLGQPEDLAGALVFLAAPASAFVTGQILHVDGGFTAT
ncbi:gluconate 5-dehydrogenase/3-oxoacyl-[acyl-carrier protein] reductase [Stella humosa]|uniref:Gluconate 5-dehydrogenase/3-oxoacyl-[acyl-carrier protein] reductase n=1 Tax=Stella humosa TaxID=94 RepID=A0A3N1KZX5_9PROT|nr:glucose 1-dehydrogenase [Stella humosa]ROP83756.1 gluconate 5-dehydrogenase/3-oxoacyl-[acyl-carrier protein] reductase [Stella humosa]BBK32983.1 2-deoxy-D-gluconate 3-dehydrogenase [Stella humosa]